MPNLYADIHDKLMEDYLLTLESNILNTNFKVIGISKNGYIVPGFLYIRVNIFLYTLLKIIKY